jgi:argininosuccinate lyase
MLGVQELVDPTAAGSLLNVLDGLDAMEAGAFPFDARLGDLYGNIQAYVIDRLGPEIGGSLYMGRARPDTEATTLRLFVRDGVLLVIDSVCELIGRLLARAEQHVEAVMPGFTGSQPAQPWTVGHYLASFADAFARDLERVERAYDSVNTSLAGGAAGSGSDLDIDRSLVAALLGCSGLIENAREFVTCNDAAVEAAAACVVLLTHLSQLTSDLNLWSTREFGLIELSDELSHSSSYVPQKKNPAPFPMIRSVANAAVGELVAIFSILHTTSWDFDRVQLAEPMARLLADSVATVEYMSSSIDGLMVDEARMRRGATDGWTTASEVARVIQDRAAVDWRRAHWVAERFMRIVLERGLTPSGVTGDLLDEAGIAILGSPLGIDTVELRGALDVQRFVETRRTSGSVNPAEVRRLIAARRDHLAAARSTQLQRRSAIERANERLRALGEAFHRPDPRSGSGDGGEG